MLFALSMTICHAQNDKKRIVDSLALEGRKRADLVLSYLDSIQGKKMLYSVEKRDFNGKYLEDFYYISIQNINGPVTSFYVTAGRDGEMSIFKRADEHEFDRWEREKYEKNGSLESDLEDFERSFLERSIRLQKAFNTKLYNTDFIILYSKDRAGKIIITDDYFNYFVLKDEIGNRYGEYWSQGYVWPKKMDGYVQTYLKYGIIGEGADMQNPFI